MDGQEKLLNGKKGSFLFHLLVFKEDFLTPVMSFETEAERNFSGLNAEPCRPQPTGAHRGPAYQLDTSSGITM